MSFSSRMKRWRTNAERQAERERQISQQILLAYRKKEGFWFQGRPFNVYRLLDGTIVVRGSGGSIIKNPPPKLIEKVKIFFANVDAFEVMES